jgi:hypothetical protein
MTRLGITFEEVQESAEKILAEGENPTIEKIRFVLGTGSNSTIAKYLSEWRSKRLMASVHEMPPSNTVSDPVHAAVNQVWQQIREESKAEIKLIQQKANEEIELARKHREDAFIARDHIITQFEELQIRFNQVSANKELLSLDLQSSHQEHQILQERHQLIQQQLSANIYELKEAQKNTIDSHQKEVILLKSVYDKAMDKFSLMHENERQRHIAMLDSEKVEKQKNEKVIQLLDKDIHHFKTELAKEKITTLSLLKERDDAIKISINKDTIIEQERETHKDLQIIISGIISLTCKVDESHEISKSYFALQDNSAEKIEEMSKCILNLLSKRNEPVEQE